MALGLAAVLAVLISRQDLEHEELVFCQSYRPPALRYSGSDCRFGQAAPSQGGPDIMVFHESPPPTTSPTSDDDTQRTTRTQSWECSGLLAKASPAAKAYPVTKLQEPELDGHYKTFREGVCTDVKKFDP